MKHEKKDFEKMPNNPLALRGEQKMWEKYRAIASVRDLSEVPTEVSSELTCSPEEAESTLNDLVKFVALHTEPESNPMCSILDFEQRADACFRMLGMTRKSMAYRMIESNHYWFRLVEAAYFRVIDNDTFQLWFSLKTQFFETSKLVRKEYAADESAAGIGAREAAARSLPAALEKIRSLESALFPDERTRKNVTLTGMATALFAERFAEDYVPVRQ